MSEKHDVAQPEGPALFGMLDAAVPQTKDAPPPDDGGSRIALDALNEAVEAAKRYDLATVDLEDPSSVLRYLEIKNSKSCDISQETPFEKVVETTQDGMHEKEVRYLRIIDFTRLDEGILVKELVKKTKLGLIPRLLGVKALSKYFNPATATMLIDAYDKEIGYTPQQDETEVEDNE